MSEVLRKKPDSSKTFTLNWATYPLGSVTITGSSWTLPAGVTEDDSDFTDTTTSIKLGGGTDGTDYELLNVISLSNGDTEQQSVVVQVRSASWELTEDEIVTVAEIITEDYAATVTLLEDINVNQAASIRDDLATWATIRDSHVRLRGGSKGVDFDNERKREAIRQRIRKALGLSLVSSELMPGSVSVPHTWVY